MLSFMVLVLFTFSIVEKKLHCGVGTIQKPKIKIAKFYAESWATASIREIDNSVLLKSVKTV